MLRSYILYFAILVLAFILRVIFLEKVPQVLSLDEINLAVFFSGSIIGESVFFLRLASVIFGTVTIGVFYFLAKIFFIKIGIKKSFLPYTAMLLLALTPWHVQLSRVDLVANVALLFLIIILIVIMKYFSGKMMIPLVLLGVLLLVYGIAGNYKKDSTEVYLLTAIEQTASNRIAYSTSTPLSKIVHDKNIEKSKLYMRQAFGYIEPSKLFFAWDYNPSYVTKNSGLLYPLDIIFLGFGIAYLFKKNRQTFLLLLLFSAIVLLPPVFTGSSADFNKVMLLFPIVILVVALGARILITKINNKKIAIFLCVLYALTVARFYYHYYLVYPNDISVEGEYKKVFIELNNKNIRKNIVIVDESFGRNIDRYALYYLRDAKKYSVVFEEPKKYISNTLYIRQVKNKDSDKFKLGIFEKK